MKRHALISLLFLGTLIALIALIGSVHATNVLNIKEHHPTPSAFTDPSGTYDGYIPGTMITFHIHLNVTASTAGNPPLSISNFNITDNLPNLAGSGPLYMTYVSGSQNSNSSAGAAAFTDFGNGTLFWDFGAGPFTTPVEAPPPFSTTTNLYTASITFNATVNSNVPDNTFLTNEGVAKYKETISGINSSPSTSDTIWVARPILDIIKQNPAKVENGSSFNYILTLNNTGHLDATGINVTDFLPSGVTHTPGTSTTTSGSFAVDSGAQVVWTGTIGNVTGTHVVTITIPVTANTPLTSVFNLANYAAYPSYAQFTNAQASCTTGVLHPAIALTKTPSASKIENNANVTYTYNVTNTGDVTLTFNLTDDTFGNIALNQGPLAVGQLMQFFKTTTLTQNTTNIATATGVDQTGASVNATATATVNVINPAIALTKTPSASKIENNTSVTYTYNVTNTGDTTLTVGLTDDKFGTIFTGLSLGPGVSNITTVTKTLIANTTNTATATGVDQTGASVNATATATVNVIHPAISLAKTPSASKIENNTSVTYTYNVTNTGDVALTGNVTDDVFGLVGTFTLQPNGWVAFTVSHVLTANTTNIATATGVDQTGASVTANATAFVQVIHPAISLTKTASPNTSQQAPATFNYTYTVTNTGDVALTGVTVYDETFNVLILGPVPLNVGQSATGTYSQTYAAAGTYVDYANATGVDQTGATVNARANATVVVTPPPQLTTRTWGFWKTHTNFTEWVFTNRLNNFTAIDSGSIHAKNITTYAILFGAFEADVAKMSNGTKRTLIDSARISLLHQLLGAILNTAAFNSTVPIDPVTGLNLIQAANIAYSGNNATEINRLAGLLDTFNGSGDNIAFPPGLPPQGNATPQDSISIADVKFWDVL